MSELSIKVSIAGRIYPITVKADEEQNVRLAAKRVDDDIKALQSNYAVKDKQDLLAMTALQLATELSNHEATLLYSASDKDLAEIESLLDEML